MTALNPYSRRFAEVLFAAFPEWRAFMLDDLPEIFTGDTEGSLIVRVPCPAPAEWPPEHSWLLIDTSDEEIIISWDRFHAHFGNFSDVPESTSFEQAISFLSRLVSEKFCIAIAKNGDKWAGSMTIQHGQAPDFLAGRRSIPLPAGSSVYSRSWRGTYDTKLETTDLTMERDSSGSHYVGSGLPLFDGE